MPVLFSLSVTEEDCQRNPSWLFLFGDNYMRKGRGGQAIIRGQKNAHGIRTKFLPDTTRPSYFNDDEFLANCKMIDADLLHAFEHLAQGGTVVIPRMGIGLAKMDILAPLTFAYFTARLDSLTNFSVLVG